MGKPIRVMHVCLYNEDYIEREPCEVKHLSNMRKINQSHASATRFPK